MNLQVELEERGLDNIFKASDIIEALGHMPKNCLETEKTIEFLLEEIEILSDPNSYRV